MSSDATHVPCPACENHDLARESCETCAGTGAVAPTAREAYLAFKLAGDKASGEVPTKPGVRRHSSGAMKIDLTTDPDSTKPPAS